MIFCTASAPKEGLQHWHHRRNVAPAELAAREQVLLYGILLNLRKAVYAMDRGRCLQILEDAEVGPKALRLICTF